MIVPLGIWVANSQVASVEPSLPATMMGPAISQTWMEEPYLSARPRQEARQETNY